MALIQEVGIHRGGAAHNCMALFMAIEKAMYRSTKFDGFFYLLVSEASIARYYRSKE